MVWNISVEMCMICECFLQVCPLWREVLSLDLTIVSAGSCVVSSANWLMQVLKVGYKLHDRVIRAAQVCQWLAVILFCFFLCFRQIFVFFFHGRNAAASVVLRSRKGRGYRVFYTHASMFVSVLEQKSKSGRLCTSKFFCFCFGQHACCQHLCTCVGTTV